jgi:diguanylate cyclase (GGDEF)-like protein
MSHTLSRQEQRAARLRTGAVACVLALCAAALAHWPTAEWLAVGAGGVVGTLYWRAQTAVNRERRRLFDAIDAMQAGVVLYGPDDRLLLANTDFRRLYETPGIELRVGKPFVELLRERVHAGLVPEAKGREEAWIAERATQHRGAAPHSFLREMADGRWRRITEQVLPDGSRLGFSIDVSDLVAQQHAADAARREAERARALLDDAIEAMPAAVEIYDQADRLVLFNRRMLALYPHMEGRQALGETFETLVRRAVGEGRVPEAAGREEAWLAERLAARGGSSEPRLQRAPDGSWIHIYETPMQGGGLVTVRLDASEIVRRRRELEEAIDAIPAGVEIYDEHDRLVIYNRRLVQMYPHVAEQMSLGLSFEVLVRRSLALGMVLEARGQEEAWLAQRLERRRAARGVEQRESLAEANAALQRLSSTDALTGLANRRRFDAALAEELARAQRHGTPVSLLLVDVDHFKRFNDRHGHPEGDRALQAVAAVLARQARRPGELVARYGGEEFALLLPHSDAATVLAVAARCREAMATLALPHGDSPTAAHLTLSIGAALRHASEDAAALMARADAALYAAKAGGRARCVLSEQDSVQ